MSDDVLTFEDLMRRKRGETAPVEVVTLPPGDGCTEDDQKTLEWALTDVLIHGVGREAVTDPDAVLTIGSDEGTTPPADPEAA